MAAQARVVWDQSFTSYDFGRGHPMNPVRLDLTARLCRAFGLFDADDVAVVNPPPLSDAMLRTVHDEGYVAAVRHASAHPRDADRSRGLGTEDDPAFPDMHRASAHVAAGSVDVAQAVWTGAAAHGVNFAGGLHHAMPGRAAGFCIYNDVALAIRWLLDHGARRVAYVDVDVHHGDGVEQIFWDDPRVLTISLHESGRMLFPGTGFPGDIGGPGALGSAANLAFPAGTGDAGWLRGFHALVLPLVTAFGPDVLVTQHGCDSHFLDPLAHLTLSLDAQRSSYETLHDLAHQVCEGRWVALGGGGYELVDVVPRAWTHLTAIAAHRPIPVDAQVPAQWREHVRAVYGTPGPARMGDGVSEPGSLGYRPWSGGMDPDDAVDRAIMATRQAVFPSHGLDVWHD
ncbi:MAG TPA: acetoin utilization protein AcuC [Dermatophilaceae bacterium]|nr:acetoin utilization protein AcuC [Dermatophilaceae bacterium]